MPPHAVVIPRALVPSLVPAEIEVAEMAARQLPRYEVVRMVKRAIGRGEADRAYLLARILAHEAGRPSRKGGW